VSEVFYTPVYCTSYTDQQGGVSDDMKRIFDPVVDIILKLVETQVNSANSAGAFITVCPQVDQTPIRIHTGTNNRARILC